MLRRLDSLKTRQKDMDAREIKIKTAVDLGATRLQQVYKEIQAARKGEFTGFSAEPHTAQCHNLTGAPVAVCAATPAQGRKWLLPWATKWVPARGTKKFFVAAVVVAVAIGMGIGKSYVQVENPTAKWATYATNILNNIVVLLLHFLPEGRVRAVAEYVRDTGPPV